MNAGSLERHLLEKYGEPCPEAMVESGLDHIRILEDNDFHEFKISVKASDVFLAAAAYQGIAEATDAPIHLGITEAGGLISGTVKSAIGLGNLLWMGIGDTIRVSLSADPVEEVKVGYEILKSLGLRHRGVNIISCPSCARQGFDVIKTVEALEERLEHIKTPMSPVDHRLRGERPGRGADDRCRLHRRRRRVAAWSIWPASRATSCPTTEMIDHIVELVEKKRRRDRGREGRGRGCIEFPRAKGSRGNRRLTGDISAIGGNLRIAPIGALGFPPKIRVRRSSRTREERRSFFPPSGRGFAASGRNGGYVMSTQKFFVATAAVSALALGSLGAAYADQNANNEKITKPEVHTKVVQDSNGKTVTKTINKDGTVTTTTTEAYISVPTTIMTGPGTGYTSMKQVPAKTQMNVTGCLESHDWCKVSVDGKEGWMPAKDITVQANGQTYSLADMQGSKQVQTIQYHKNADGVDAASTASIGAATGATIGGPAGAAAGAVVGAAVGAVNGSMKAPAKTVTTYTINNPTPTVKVQGDIKQGVVVPKEVTLTPVPNSNYAYFYSGDHQPVIVNPQDRTVVQVVN